MEEKGRAIVIVISLLLKVKLSEYLEWSQDLTDFRSVWLDLKDFCLILSKPTINNLLIVYVFLDVQGII